MRAQSLGQEDPLEESTATHSSILPGESHGQRSLAGYSPWGSQELDTPEPLSMHAGWALTLRDQRSCEKRQEHKHAQEDDQGGWGGDDS